jgi:general secretion pathway protein H
MKSNSDGFTLLELIVVLVIIAICGSLVFVNVGKSIATRKNKDFAYEMISFCRTARRLSIDRGMPVAFYISSDERRCWIDNTGAQIAVPEEMLIEGEGVSAFDNGVYGISFYPDGSASGGQLTLSVGGNIVCTVKVDLITGTITAAGSVGESAAGRR